MDKCEPPKCEYSIFRQKCIKPNPYIERLSYCNRKNISKKDCSYDITIATEKACKYYKERIKLIKEPKIKEPKIKELKIKEPKIKEVKIKETKIKEPKIKETKIKEPKIKEPKIKEVKIKETKIKETKIKEPKIKEPKIKETKIKEAKEVKFIKPKAPKEVKFIKPKETKLIKEKEKELKHIRNKIDIILQELGSTNISSTGEIKKASDIILIEKLEKELDIELEKLNKLLGEKKEEKQDSNSSLISFLQNKKKTIISDRIKYYNIIHNYIKNIIDNINCFNIHKNNDLGTIEYKIGDKIILDKRIGDDNNKYGVIFLSHFKNDTNIELEKYLIFATKLTDFDRKGNLIEYQILKYLTKLNLNNICPHFPIGYGKLICSKSQNNIIKENLISNIKEKKKKILGSELYNENHIFIFNELADGSLRQLIKKGFFQSSQDIENMFMQCLMSIMFFNKYTNAYHNDCHFGNFLYHIIEPGGYYHYNIYGINYYIKNIGYLWVIWDYGLIVPYYNSYEINKNMFGTFSNKLLPITTDYKRFIEILLHYLHYHNNLTFKLLNHLTLYNYVTYDNNIKDFII